MLSAFTGTKSVKSAAEATGRDEDENIGKSS